MFNESVITILSMVGLVHMVALISPGPDFAMILRSCAQYGKRYAMLSALGLGFGVAFHVTYSLLGLKLLINAIPYIIRIIAIFGSLYFFHQGIKSIVFAFTTKNQMLNLNISNPHDEAQKSTNTWRAISSGFFTNALNPKAFVYFLSFFAATISNIKNPYLSIAAGGEVFLLTWAWFSFLAQVISSKNFLKIIQKYNFLVNLSIGIVFILFSISMIFFAYMKS